MLWRMAYRTVQRLDPETAAYLAGLVDGEARRGAIENPDVVVACGVDSFYWLFVERRWDGVEVLGDRELLERLFDAAAAPLPGNSVLA